MMWKARDGKGGEGDQVTIVEPISRAERPLTARQEVVLAVWLLLGLTGIWMWCGGNVRHPRGLVDMEQAHYGPLMFQVDVNEAHWPELTLLPRIGETISQRIVESREREGPFRRPDDLLRVHGIGPKTLERMRPLVAVRVEEGDRVEEGEGR
jgi:competence ComEA-like helix-hairpin-helix protein